MPRIGMLALFASLCLAAVGSADVPLPGGLKYFDPRVRILGIDLLRDYVFFLHYETGGDQRLLTPMHVEVRSDAEFMLKGTGRSISNVQLCAVTKQQFDKMKRSIPPRMFIDPKTPGALSAPMDSPNNTGSKFNIRGPLTEYRVTLKDGKLKVGRGMKRADAGPAPGLAGFALTLSLAALD